ncbi:hypothetical protein [Streptomyces albus]|uniref:hypothetical protein n=1 Tax=Streptomyces albus TaxID=1888 RepID=UPI0004C4E5CA|nr:hypothetical protein [Streptomyces albus]
MPVARSPGPGRAVTGHAGPGIPHWLITGARRHLTGDRDLTGPQRVRVATTAYAETEDHTGRCTLDPAHRAEQTSLCTAYRDWYRLEGPTRSPPAPSPPASGTLPVSPPPKR